MPDDLRAKLRRLGVTKGARHLKPAPKSAEPPPARTEPSPDYGFSRPSDDPQRIEQVIPRGYLIENDLGGCFAVDQVYALDHQHGQRRLADMLAHHSRTAGIIGRDNRLSELDFREMLFIDTETTGLGGAGTLAFMVGVGFFEGDALVVRQYFLRDHGDESAMLLELAGLLQKRPGVISFNGRSFDLPLLDNRFFLNRLDLEQGDLRRQPHLDLLLPSRRVWRWQWGSCSLGALEQNVLGVRRTHEDVPGSLIPWLYTQYLRSGDAEPLRRVFYHNQLDMLSMVTLAAELMTVFDEPDRPLWPLERLGLARWHLDLGAAELAETQLQTGLSQCSGGGDRGRLLNEYARFLKRANRRDEAGSLWEELAQEYDDIEAHIELAKYYEWRETDLTQALFWTHKAVALAEASPAGQPHLADLLHRLARLQRKQGVKS